MKDTFVFKPVEDVDLFVHHNERGKKRVENPTKENHAENATTEEEDQYPDAVWP